MPDVLAYLLGKGAEFLWCGRFHAAFFIFGFTNFDKALRPHRPIYALLIARWQRQAALSYLESTLAKMPQKHASNYL